MSMELTRLELASSAVKRLDERLDDIRRQWAQTGPINHFVVDDVLPEAWAASIREAFPDPKSMTLKSSLRELKYVAAQMDRYDRLLEEAIYAFQDPRIVERVQDITRLRDLEPDRLLYAGGVSLMTEGHFLNPHIDNSHDKFRERYRVLNLLYYVSPRWSLGNGGNLELWPEGPSGRPVTLTSLFNRLVVMVTHEGSWHSVSRVAVPESRCCVSNYYFSKHPVGECEYFHVTSFRGRPEQPLRDFVLWGDIRLRMLLRRLFPLGVRENPHYYKKPRK